MYILAWINIVCYDTYNIGPLSSSLYYKGMNRGPTPCDFMNRYKFIIIALPSISLLFETASSQTAKVSP